MIKSTLKSLLFIITSSTILPIVACITPNNQIVGTETSNKIEITANFTLSADGSHPKDLQEIVANALQAIEDDAKIAPEFKHQVKEAFKAK